MIDALALIGFMWIGTQAQLLIRCGISSPTATETPVGPAGIGPMIADV